MINIDTDVEGAPTLTLLATSCANGTCPTVYESDRASYVVQGYAVDAQQVGVTLGSGELLVEIPADLLNGIIASGNRSSGG